MCGLDRAGPGLTQRWFRLVIAPRPGVSEPQRRQYPETGGLRPAVVGGDPDTYIVRTALGVFDEYIEIPVVVKDSGIQQLVLEIFARQPPVRFHQVTVRKLPLRVLVQILHVRVRRRAVDVEVVFLYVLAVVPLAVGEPEQALLQDG